jgi:hypothetical protein
MRSTEDSTPWRRSQVRKAQAEIQALERPEGCDTRRWRAVVELLLRLAEHLPNIEVSQHTLAAKLVVDERTVRRRVSWAVELGVLEVLPLPTYHGHWKHNHYHLVGVTTVGHPCPPAVIPGGGFVSYGP